METALPLKPLLVESAHHGAYPEPANSSGSLESIQLGHRKFWLDGSIVLNGRVATNLDELAKILPVDLALWSVERIADWWSRSARNVGALFVQDNEEEWSACLPDPLGGALAFYSKEQGSIVVSTDINEIINFYSSNGRPLEKDPLFQVERIIFGNGGLVNSSFKNINTIKPFQYLVIRSGSLRVNDYSVLDSLLEMSYADLFQRLKEDVLSSVNAILDSPLNQKIGHVTGGFDSRLVMSAIRALGRTSEVTFFCSGPAGTTDRLVADSLTSDYGLRRVDGAGLTPAPTNLMAERLLGPLFASGGITSSGPIGRERSVAVSALGGGYGEVLRTFYGQRAIADELGALSNDIVRGSYLQIDKSHLNNISSEALRSLEDLLLKQFRHLNDRFENVDFIGDAHYTYGRNRYHIGQNSLLWSRIGARFDPLYSVAGFALASKVPQTVRFSNVIGFDLMDTFDRSLLEHKFDYDRFNDSLLTMRRRPVQRDLSPGNNSITFETAQSPGYRESSEFLGILKNLKAEPPQVTARERQAIIDQSNKMGVNFWQLFNKASGQQLLKAAYDNVTDRSVFNFFNEKYVIELFSKENLNRQQLRDLYNIGGIISWLSFG
ncbi:MULTISPECIES: hypothetical protein [unclassified Arthrobacter]|uniref:hypothetical protein n=1 Tax=unclassified Arthrobacter TaxID=235627 RepID=UPI0011B0AEBD|nr:MULTISPECIES: hypothetical protein [unclassified Arthrobacter]